MTTMVKREFWAAAIESIVFESKAVDLDTAYKLAQLADAIRLDEPKTFYGKIVETKLR